jgi:biotin operon repressor
MTQILTNKQQVWSAMQLIAKQTDKPVKTVEIMKYLGLERLQVWGCLTELRKEGAIRKSVRGFGYVLLK